MDNNMEPWEREWRECEKSWNGISNLSGDESTVYHRMVVEGRSYISINRCIGYRAAYLSQQAKIDELESKLAKMKEEIVKAYQAGEEDARKRMLSIITQQRQNAFTEEFPR